MSDEKKSIPSRSGEQRKHLQGSGSQSQNLLDLAASRLTDEELSSLRKKALEEKLRLEVQEHERSSQYEYGRRLTEDHIEAFRLLDKSGKLTSQKVSSEINSGAGKMRIESKTGTTCFVATATYGDPNHEDVVFLRNYRDSILAHNVPGRIFVKVYWLLGPWLAVPVRSNAKMRAFSKLVIGRLVKRLKARQNSLQ